MSFQKVGRMAWEWPDGLIDCDFAIASGIRMRTLVIASVLLIGLVACGYKGPLYLPQNSTAAQSQ